MRHIILYLLACCIANTLAAQKLSVSDLTCEYQSNPLGLDVPQPRVSWKVVSPARNTLQTAYEFRVGTDAKTLPRGQGIVWQSGKVTSSQSVLVSYKGPALLSRQAYYWQVRVWDNHGNTSAWSPINRWETALLQPADWTAKWIEPILSNDSVNQPAALLRRSFTLTKQPASARLYVTAHGLYEAHINGKRVGDLCLTPGWTSYNKHLQYQTYDVTSLLKQGTNATGVILAEGWYRGELTWDLRTNVYGNKTGLLYQLNVTYTDGTSEIITSDSQWKTSTGPIRKTSLYYGEAFDARRDNPAWTTTDFNDSAWQGVTQASYSNINLVAAYGPPVRKHETFKAVRIFKTPKGETVIDFGQNLVGWINLTVKGRAGETVRIHHTEVLDKQKNFYIDNLRAAKQEVLYTLKGQGTETYSPRFAFFGFRYIRVQGYPGELTPESITATAVYSDMPATGSFTCSNPLINQLQHNIQWGQKGNFVDVPTDCPQRDERLGWTGDAQVFARTAAYNMNVAPFFRKWLKDLTADQRRDGAVPFVIPNALDSNAVASAGWADAATIIPSVMYRAYGDTMILKQQYESMKAWVRYMEQHSKDYLWNTGFHFGDWLFYRPFDDNDGRAAVTDKYLIAQCFFAHSTQRMIEAARILGRTSDEQHYSAQLLKIKEAFVKEYLTASGRLVSSTQTAYVLALHFDMLPEHLRKSATERLVQNVSDYGSHLTTGFLGTPYLCEVLSRYGYTSVAYALLTQESYPSWLYPVKMGATTIWERWDGMKPDSTFQTPGMNSFNHYAYGAIGDWMYRTVTGIKENAPGYKEIVIEPQPGGKLTHAQANLETPYGRVASSWKINNGTITLTVEIPTNTTGRVILPAAARATLSIRATEKPGPPLNGLTPTADGNNVSITLGSGTYTFEYPWTKIE